MPSTPSYPIRRARPLIRSGQCSPPASITIPKRQRNDSLSHHIPKRETSFDEELLFDMSPVRFSPGMESGVGWKEMGGDKSLLDSGNNSRPEKAGRYTQRKPPTQEPFLYSFPKFPGSRLSEPCQKFLGTTEIPIQTKENYHRSPQHHPAFDSTFMTEEGYPDLSSDSNMPSAPLTGAGSDAVLQSRGSKLTLTGFSVAADGHSSTARRSHSQYDISGPKRTGRNKARASPWTPLQRIEGWDGENNSFVGNESGCFRFQKQLVQAEELTGIACDIPPFVHRR